MGNCQAAEAAAVMIQHPGAGGGRVERIYCSVRAKEVMNSNPGHYVAMVISALPLKKSEEIAPPSVLQLKLIRPDDTLLLGHVYRLVSFEDVLKEFSAKKSVKLGKLLKKTGALDASVTASNSSDYDSSMKVEENGVENGCITGTGRHADGGWRPALQSIPEAAL